MYITKLVRAFFLAEAVFLLLLYFFVSIEYNRVVLLWIVAIALIDAIAIIYVQNRRGINIKYRLISTLFLIGYLIVFYQCYVDLLLGNIEADDNLFVSSQIIIKCCLISTIGLSAFGFGYLTINSYNRKSDGNIKYEVGKLSKYRVLFYIATVLYFIFNIRKILSGEYSQEILEAEAGTMVLYSDMLFIITFVVLLAHILIKNIQNREVSFVQYNTQFGLVSLTCMIMYCLANVIVGDRGPIIICLSIYFGAYFLISKGVLNKTKVIFFISIAVLFFSVLGQIRKDDRQDRFQNINASVSDVYNNNSIIPFTKELSASVTTLHHSVYYVPDKHPYLYWIFPIRYVGASIPFGDRLLFSIFPMPKRYVSSAFFVTWLIQGDYYTYGNGTSCNADLYLSFGVVGVLLGLWLWGLFICFLERKAYNRNISINLIIIYLFTCGYAVYVNRAYFLVFMNYCVFTIIINYLYDKFFLTKSK